MRPEPKKVLVVATRTAACSELVDVLSDRAVQEQATFHLLVPATPYGWAWLADMYSGGVDAERYLAAAVSRYREAGIELESAQLGDPDPVAAVMDAVHFARFDELVVSTLPRHLSKWLRLSLPHRLRSVTGLPVTHVVGTQVRLVDRTDTRRSPHKAPAHSVYLDGHGSARVLDLEEARGSLGAEGLKP
jgi:nucleotide-binding universal stress UspA family protein